MGRDLSNPSTRNPLPDFPTTFVVNSPVSGGKLLIGIVRGRLVIGVYEHVRYEVFENLHRMRATGDFKVFVSKCCMYSSSEVFIQ